NFKNYIRRKYNEKSKHLRTLSVHSIIHSKRIDMHPCSHSSELSISIAVITKATQIIDFFTSKTVLREKCKPEFWKGKVVITHQQTGHKTIILINARKNH